MIDSIVSIAKYRELLYMIVWRDIHVRYKQSVMGVLWAMLMPIIIVLAGLLVRYGLAVVSSKPLLLSDIGTVALKSVPWAFFVASVRFSTNCLVGNSNLVTKVYFPRVVFPVASVFSQLFDLLVASGVLIAILFAIRVGLSIELLWVPLLVALLMLLAIGIGVFLSAANLFYRDVKYLVEVVLTFAIFFTPVFYDVAMFGKWADLLMLNPVAPILEGLRCSVICHAQPPGTWLVYSAAITLASFAAAFTFFARLEPLFAERI